jgi:OmcA/MtrC family decaheme c-type cytochrome
MRAVGLQGYFTQVSPALARHAKSVVKSVVVGTTADPVRRVVVDNDKCANCHEWLELHGGNRVYETGVCVMCHVPNLTSGGRGADPATAVARLAIGDAANGDPAGTQAAALTAAGYNPADPSTWPEATNNFKNMIHGIHGSGKRTAPYRFVRDRGTSGIYYYDWSHVHFPGILKNCETCHRTPMQGGGYDLAIPAGALASIDITTDGNAGTSVTTDRSTVPNALDLVSTPITATCVMCHDSAPAKAHMTSLASGGYISTDRTTVNTAVAAGAGEQCMTCHGPGKVAAIAEMHAK